MHEPIRFETPENVEIRYQPAGLGTRFVAWLIDYILVSVCTLFLMFLLVFGAAIAGWALDELFNSIGRRLEEAGEGDEEAVQEILMVFMGVGVLVWGLGSFIYFTLSELLMRGQTIGKRLMDVRVVKTNGFSLDPLSIVVRNFFRVVDQLSPFWIVPLLSRRSQRFGDMAAGTVVISEAPVPIPLIRKELADRSAAEAVFRFDRAALERLRPIDWIAVERLLDRWDDLPPRQLQHLLDTMIAPLAARLKLDPPTEEQRLKYLEDLLAAEYRRQTRALL